MNTSDLQKQFTSWKKRLRLENQWAITLALKDDPNFKKTGDLTIDADDKKAEIMINIRNPKQENLEEVIVHELLHLKLYPMDQMIEKVIDSHVDKDSQAYDYIYTDFMITLETTVAEMTKCFLDNFGENKDYSYGRLKTMKSFNELYEGLKSLK